MLYKKNKTLTIINFCLNQILPFKPYWFISNKYKLSRIFIVLLIIFLILMSFYLKEYYLKLQTTKNYVYFAFEILIKEKKISN
jgi:hypothetical protein